MTSTNHFADIDSYLDIAIKAKRINEGDLDIAGIFCQLLGPPRGWQDPECNSCVAGIIVQKEQMRRQHKLLRVAIWTQTKL